ncbi:RHS repeat-associated core domain-containing protein [Pseudomonas moorei]|uniref:RHS repeat-associated core domain-containing protein n=1 Tax=Pseudomonas moorei TaxID=395599 RepID=UPI0036F318FA
MPSNQATVLCHYHYDALNRLAASTPSAQAITQRFYLKDRLTTEIQGAVQRSIIQHEDHLLAQRERQTAAVQTQLLATDQQRSVLNLLGATQRHPLVYTPYGHHWLNVLLSLLGFNGERRDPLTGWYFLGNGYRAFNTVLMRFNSPDSWSPFGEGGLNTYAYCKGDPIGRRDPTGHFSFLASLRQIGSRLQRPPMFHASAMAALAGAAGLIVETTVELDETSNTALLLGSSLLLGVGLGGMYSFRHSATPRPISRRQVPTPGRVDPPTTPATAPQRNPTHTSNVQNIEMNTSNLPRSSNTNGSGAANPPLRIPRPRLTAPTTNPNIANIRRPGIR